MLCYLISGFHVYLYAIMFSCFMYNTHNRSLGLQECAANFNECKTCAGTNLFSPQQQKVCSANGEKELVKAISKGALECIRDCQKQFSDSQWNCTTFQGEHLFGSFVENGEWREGCEEGGGSGEVV